MHRRNRRILLSLAAYTGLSDALRQGIADFVATEGSWEYGPFPQHRWRSLDLAGVDGVVGAVPMSAAQQVLLDAGVPLVNTMHGDGGHRVPSVYSDDRAIGRLAAEHLLERGLRQLAVLTQNPGEVWRDRMSGFTDSARSAGARVTLAIASNLAPGGSPDALAGARRAWLADLPLPCGLFAGNDLLGAEVMVDLQALGRRVPDEIAVVGADNAILPCLFASPPLSSVQPDWYRIGYESAALLARLMAGDPPPGRPILIPPLGVVTRRSSDAIAVRDPEIASALRFIRDHAGQRIDVNDILAAIPLARRSLERKFRAQLGHSPSREIKRTRIEHVKRLLIQNDWPMPKVAASSAFRDARDLSTQFRKETGMTPTAYRRQHRTR